MIKDVMKNVDLYVDGTLYLGKCESVEPPKLNLRMEEYRGGLDAPVEVDMGLEKLECTVTTFGLDPDLLALWGVKTGSDAPLVFRAAQEDGDGAVQAIRMDIRGRVKGIDWGEWKTGERVPNKVMIAVRYYKLEVDGRVLHEIDAENLIRIVNGVDQMAAIRQALGR